MSISSECRFNLGTDMILPYLSQVSREEGRNPTEILVVAEFQNTEDSGPKWFHTILEWTGDFEYNRKITPGAQKFPNL